MGSSNNGGHEQENYDGDRKSSCCRVEHDGGVEGSCKVKARFFHSFRRGPENSQTTSARL